MATPAVERSRRRGDVALCLALALAAFAVYVWLLAPTVTGEDSGELITAAYFLGIPHPPGYPFWCLAAHPFTWLPMGNVAWRVNLASAAFGAATVGLIAGLALRLLRERWAAVFAGVALALTPEFIEQATIAEVYTLNALLLALALHTLRSWQRTKAPRTLYVLGLITGLGLATHNTFIVLAPFFALWALWIHRPPLRVLVIAALGTLPGLLTFAYLPLRSLADPPIDWGDPETPARFWAVVSRAQYAHMFSAAPREWGRFAGQMQWWGLEFFRQSAFVLAPVSLYGLYLLHRRNGRFGLLLVAVAIISLVSITYVQNFDLTREWLMVMSVFGIPAWMVSALGVGMAVARLPQSARDGWAPLLPLLCIVLLLAPLARQTTTTRAPYVAEDYGRNILEQLPADAYYVAQADHAAFSTLYLQAVEGLRPDVTLVRTYGYVRPEVFAPYIDPWPAAWSPYPPQSAEPELFAALLRGSDRPLYFQQPPKLPKELGVRLVPEGLLWRALRPGEVYIPRDAFAGYRWRGLGHASFDYTAALVQYELARAEAEQLLLAGDVNAALIQLERAVNLGEGGDGRVLNDVGITLARRGLAEHALPYFRAAAERAPHNAEIRANLARAQAATKR